MNGRWMGRGGREESASVGSEWSRKTFVVGKLTRKSAEFLLAEAARTVRGPFLVKAVVRGARVIKTAETVH